jgi:hypothetical protein
MFGDAVTRGNTRSRGDEARAVSADQCRRWRPCVALHRGAAGNLMRTGYQEDVTQTVGLDDQGDRYTFTFNESYYR